MRSVNLDKHLKIRTSGRDERNSDDYRFPYEPTPYEVLERLAESDLISDKNVVLDYGCGKGRVGFYLSLVKHCRYIGVDVDSDMINAALENKDNSIVGNDVEFVLKKTEEYEVPGDVDVIYFFNPFSVEILNSVISKILDSYYDSPREITLIFYYPSDKYMGALMSYDELMFYDEIDCMEFFRGKNKRERMVIFRLEM